MAYERKTASAGQRFGLWTVVREAQRRANYRYWLCRCDCGVEREVAQYTLTRGRTKSCRCTFTTHGEANKTNEYLIWRGMLQRCRDPKAPEFPRYGGRGIRVCARWRDYANFLADMGRRPSKQHSLDRIDNDGWYEPFNVRWATDAEQNSNKRTNRYVMFAGARLTFAQFSDMLGLHRVTTRRRLLRGETPEQIAAHSPSKYPTTTSAS